MLDAFKALGWPDKKDFPWLTEETPSGNFKRSTLLYELGRCPEHLIPDYAAQLCELKPSVKEGVAMLRRARLGQNVKSADYQTVYTELAKSLNDLLVRYPDTDKTAIQMALALLAEQTE